MTDTLAAGISQGYRTTAGRRGGLLDEARFGNFEFDFFRTHVEEPPAA